MGLKRWAYVALPLLLASAPMARAQDAAAGEKVFARCAICHSLEAGKGSTIGPHLDGVVGRRAGTVPGYMYSPGMAKAGITWTKPNLDKFIASPATIVPGNKMPFAGLPDAHARADLIAFLATKK